MYINQKFIIYLNGSEINYIYFLFYDKKYKFIWLILYIFNIKQNNFMYIIFSKKRGRSFLAFFL